ncbi:MAG: DUF1566 domain-containing protein [Myxococcales bacterium]|nr:DUF1566 domain-containing protein [Myxococcales bacterium]
MTQTSVKRNPFKIVTQFRQMSLLILFTTTMSAACAVVVEDDLCTPNQKSCIDGNPYQCSSTGEEFVALTPGCQLGETCIAGKCVVEEDTNIKDDVSIDVANPDVTTPEDTQSGDQLGDVEGSDLISDTGGDTATVADSTDDTGEDEFDDTAHNEDTTGDAATTCDPSDCDDNNVCTTEECNEQGDCVSIPATGQPCDDGDICSANEVCNKGTCRSDTPTICEDNNPCTEDSCVPEVGCSFEAITGVPCDDGEPCTESDKCTRGLCMGTWLFDCNDENPCTKDLCDPEVGCAYEPLNGGLCDGPGLCLAGGVCENSECTGGKPKTCDDQNPCTADTCLDTMGCSYIAVDGEVCEDNNPCTVEDLCNNGVCTGGKPKTCEDSDECTENGCDPTSGCTFVEISGTACNDDDLCTTGDICKNGACVGQESVNCNDDNPCSNDSCKNGVCEYVAVENGAACDDGDACTTDTVCFENICAGGTPLDCSDGNPCMETPCDVDTGCATPIPLTGTLCDDNNLCTTSESCQNGTCEALTTLVCNDNEVCTFDECDPLLGCFFVAAQSSLSCDDGNPCSAPDHCEFGKCKPGTPTVCNDNEACTADTCSVTKGCVFTPILGACTDNNACTVGDSCKVGKCVPGTTLVNCNDGLACTIDNCDSETGKCAFNPKPMDAQPCTAVGSATGVCDTGMCIALPHPLPSGVTWIPAGQPNGLPFAMPWPPDTGQQKCYSASQPDLVLICNPPTEQCGLTPGCGQDGQLNLEEDWFSPNRMQKLTLTGVSGQVWADNETGLFWSPVSTAKGSYSSATTICTNYGDLIDGQPWRVPSWHELWTLIHFGKHDPALVHPAATSASSSDLLWTNTQAFAGSRWTVDAYDGRLVAISDETAKLGIVCVNGQGQPQTVPHRFFTAKIAETTVAFDPWTDLLWQTDPGPADSWTNALSHCENLTDADLDLWRLPTISELASLQNNVYDGAIDTTVFGSAANKQYWSSTTLDVFPSQAWVAYQYYGGTGFATKTSSAHVRCVVSNPVF